MFPEIMEISVLKNGKVIFLLLRTTVLLSVDTSLVLCTLEVSTAVSSTRPSPRAPSQSRRMRVGCHTQGPPTELILCPIQALFLLKHPEVSTTYPNNALPLLVIVWMTWEPQPISAIAIIIIIIHPNSPTITTTTNPTDREMTPRIGADDTLFSLCSMKVLLYMLYFL